jgi:hypothetical protein
VDETSGFSVVAVGPFARMRELQRLLASSGCRAEIVSPPGANANA